MSIDIIAEFAAKNGVDIKLLDYDLLRSEPRSLLDWIPKQYRAAIRDGSSTVDVSAYIQTAVNSYPNIRVPFGLYNLGSKVVMSTAGGRLIGDGFLANTATLNSRCVRFKGLPGFAGNALLELKATTNTNLLNMVLAGISLQGDMTEAYQGLRVIRCQSTFIGQIRADNFGKAGVVFDSLANCRIDNVFARQGNCLGGEAAILWQATLRQITNVEVYSIFASESPERQMWFQASPFRIQSLNFYGGIIEGDPPDDTFFGEAQCDIDNLDKSEFFGTRFTTPSRASVINTPAIRMGFDTAHIADVTVRDVKFMNAYVQSAGDSTAWALRCYEGCESIEWIGGIKRAGAWFLDAENVLDTARITLVGDTSAYVISNNDIVDPQHVVVGSISGARVGRFGGGTKAELRATLFDGLLDIGGFNSVGDEKNITLNPGTNTVNFTDFKVSADLGLKLPFPDTDPIIVNAATGIFAVTAGSHRLTSTTPGVLLNVYGINNTDDGDIVFLALYESATPVTLKDSSASNPDNNLRLRGDCLLTQTADRIVLQNRAGLLEEICRSVANPYDVTVNAVNPPDLYAGQVYSGTVSIPGLEIGDRVSISANQPLQGIRLHAEVTATDTVTYYFTRPNNPAFGSALTGAQAIAAQSGGLAGSFSKNITGIVGIQLGDFVQASTNEDRGRLTMNAQVTVTDGGSGGTVQVRFDNQTNGIINLSASQTVSVLVTSRLPINLAAMNLYISGSKH